MSRNEERLAAALESRSWRETGSLSLRGLGLKALPNAPRDLIGLRALDLSSNRLTTLPDWVWEIETLEALDISGNRLRDLSPRIAELTHLLELDVSENRLRVLPGELVRCDLLSSLDAYGNQLEDLTVVADLSGLVRLDVAGNRLRAIDGLPGQAPLAYLDLSANQIVSLPLSFAGLRALRSLDLSGNRLTSASISAISELLVEELYLDDNALQERPAFIDAMRTLRRFSTHGNPFATADDRAVSDRSEVGSQAAAVIEGLVSGDADPERRYFDAPTYSFDFTVNVSGKEGTRQIVDLYYKRFSDVSATIELGAGTNIALQDISRRTAFALIDEHEGPAGAVSLELDHTKHRATVERAKDFVAQAIARLDRVTVVPDDGADAFVFEQPSPPRSLNVAIVDEAKRPVARTPPLLTLQEYFVRLDIGPVSGDSIVTNPVAVPTQLVTPTSAEGWWFEVVASSSDVTVAADRHRVFLPFEGRSWVCDCVGQDHVCAPGDRRPFLYLPFCTRTDADQATLRCTLYDRNNAVQSVRTRFAVGPASTHAVVLHAVIDYTLAEDLADAKQLPPRQLNVLTNESAKGDHTIVVKGDGTAIAYDLAEQAATKMLRDLRSQLTTITLGHDGKTSQYGANNEKNSLDFFADLGKLAHLGAVFWQAAVPNLDHRDHLRQLLLERSTIQISRVTSSVFPWALVYDIPHTLNGNWKNCRLLERWDDERTSLAGYPTACPHAAEHTLNVLCPYGFWGLRHLIEQPPTVERGVLEKHIPVAPGARAAVARSLELDSAMSAVHLKHLATSFGSRLAVASCQSSDELLQAIKVPQLPIVYFYCHGKVVLLSDTELAVPYLEIGTNDIVGTGDFGAWAEAGEWDRRNWVAVPPLVFINGCHTAALSPENVVSFVASFAGVHAAGVVGTEIAVEQSVAGEFAETFFGYLTGHIHTSVGEALYQARIDLLIKGNLCGLAYTPFCSTDLDLVSAEVT